MRGRPTGVERWPSQSYSVFLQVECSFAQSSQMLQLGPGHEELQHSRQNSLLEDASSLPAPLAVDPSTRAIRHVFQRPQSDERAPATPTEGRKAPWGARKAPHHPHGVAHRAAGERRQPDDSRPRVWGLPQHRGGLRSRPGAGAGNLRRGELRPRARQAAGAAALPPPPPPAARTCVRLLRSSSQQSSRPQQQVAIRSRTSLLCRRMPTHCRCSLLLFRCTWPLISVTSSVWLPRRSRWTTRKRGSPSPPSARWVLQAVAGPGRRRARLKEQVGGDVWVQLRGDTHRLVVKHAVPRSSRLSLIVLEPHPAHPAQIKILSALAGAKDKVADYQVGIAVGRCVGWSENQVGSIVVSGWALRGCRWVVGGLLRLPRCCCTSQIATPPASFTHASHLCPPALPQLRNNVIGLREIVRSGSHKANNFKGSIYMVSAVAGVPVGQRCCWVGGPRPKQVRGETDEPTHLPLNHPTTAGV